LLFLMMIECNKSLVTAWSSVKSFGFSFSVLVRVECWICRGDLNNSLDMFVPDEDEEDWEDGQLEILGCVSADAN